MWNKHRMPAPKLTAALLLIAAVFLSGCFEEKSEYTINPDFSGKVVFELTFVPNNLSPTEPGDTPDQAIKPEIEQLLRRSKGVDTWKDISFKLTDKGEVRFTGTAYFPDINKLSLWRSEPYGATGLQFTRDQSGRIIIGLEDSLDSADKNKKEKTPQLSETQLIQQVKLTRLRYNQSRPMLQATFGTLKQDLLLHLPAKLEETSIFKKVDDTTVQWKTQGSDMIAAMDRLMADDEQLKNLILRGSDPFDSVPDDAIFNSFLFGQEGPIRAVLSSDSHNLFDYEAEVAAARGSYDKMLEDLDLDLKPRKPVKMPASSSIPANPGSVTVAGVRLVRVENRDSGIRPFNQFKKGYTLALILELPEPNLAVVQGEVTKAVTDTGQNLIPEHDRKTSFPKLSEDGIAAMFEVNLSIPNKDARSIAELSGTLGYLKSGSTRKIDLGVMDFKNNAKSSVEGFSINTVEVSRYSGRGQMNLKVNLLRSHLKAVKFYHEDGTEFEASQTGESYSEDSLYGIHYTTEGEFPPRGRIVIEVLDEISRHEIQFDLTNISLTGEQL